MQAIEAIKLTRRFGSILAVNKVSLSVAEGEIFGFLGANGAGKSTTIRMLTGLLEPSEGDAIVGGYSIVKSPNKVKEHIGYMSQKFSLYEDLTIEENIKFFGGVYGLKTSELNARKESILKLVDIKYPQNIVTKILPVGIKQRLALGISLLHRPKIVFLDEPTSGTDPLSRRNFWEIIQSIANEGISTFVTTHYLEEAEYCNNIALIDKGKIIAIGNPQKLKKTIFSERPIFEIDVASIENVLLLLNQEKELGEFAIFGTKLHLYSQQKNANESTIVDYLLQKYSIQVQRIRKIQPTLEDVFIHYIESNNSGSN